MTPFSTDGRNIKFVNLSYVLPCYIITFQNLNSYHLFFNLFTFSDYFLTAPTLQRRKELVEILIIIVLPMELETVTDEESH